MADTNKLGTYSVLETVHNGLMDISVAIRPLLVLLALPSLITGVYQYIVFADFQKDTPITTFVTAMIPEYLISAPFYMALLYLISRVRHEPPTTPKDSALAGVALFMPFVLTTLLVLVVVIVAALLLSLVIQVQDGQLVIGLPGLIAIIGLYGVLLALSFYPHIILFEQRSGITALKQSLGLFRRYWRRILAVLFFPVMLVLLIQNLWLYVVIGTSGTDETPGLLITIISQVVSWGILGLFEAVRLTLFQDLRARGGKPIGNI
jgi:hypothetical protein